MHREQPQHTEGVYSTRLTGCQQNIPGFYTDAGLGWISAHTGVIRTNHCFLPETPLSPRNEWCSQTKFVSGEVWLFTEPLRWCLTCSFVCVPSFSECVTGSVTCRTLGHRSCGGQVRFGVGWALVLGTDHRPWHHLCTAGLGRGQRYSRHHGWCHCTHLLLDPGFRGSHRPLGWDGEGALNLQICSWP